MQTLFQLEFVDNVKPSMAEVEDLVIVLQLEVLVLRALAIRENCAVPVEHVKCLYLIVELCS